MAARGAASVVASPHVVCYWTRAGLIVHNYATGARLPATAHHVAILDAAAAPRAIASLRAACPDLAASAADAIVRQLRTHGLLHDRRRPLPRVERAMAALGGWHPEAGFFHTATKDVNFAGVHDSASPAAGSHGPGLKRCRGLPVTRLPLGPLTGDFPAAVLARRTARRFASRAVAAGDLATLLRLTAGVHWTYRSGGRVVSLRTSPSGGASHPIEVYVAARRVRGLSQGLYHYESDRHRLHRIGPVRAFDRYLPGQPWFRGAAAMVFFAGVFARTHRRYPYSRAYKAVLVEAGHLAQTFCLAATWLALAPFCSLAIADRVVDGDLGLDGISESVLYAAGVGARFDAPVNLAPDGTPQPTLRRNRSFAEA